MVLPGERTGELNESVFAPFHHSRLAWVFKLRLEVLWVWILSFGKPSAHSARCYNLPPCLFCPRSLVEALLVLQMRTKRLYLGRIID